MTVTIQPSLPLTQELYQAFKQELNGACNLGSLEYVRVAFLGKKGKLTSGLKSLGNQPIEVRKELGAELNQLRQYMVEALSSRKAVLEESALEEKLHSEFEDLTLPALSSNAGRVHPITQVKDELIAIFADMDFSVESGPEIETDFNNFTALNIPEAHPARQNHDTFYIDKDEEKGVPYLLRTHMSTVQIRTMCRDKKPLRIIAPGRCYRSDYDATHTPMFHQIEGLVLGRDITMGHMKWCLKQFLCKFFQVDDIKMRFRPSYFPFTEPSAEVDINCKRTKDKIVLGEGDDWLEVLGCGMVHPNVLINCGLDPENIQGFAFGCGLDRLAMLKYGIPDLRTFFESDKRWLEHYGFESLDIPSPVLGGVA